MFIPIADFLFAFYIKPVSGGNTHFSADFKGKPPEEAPLTVMNAGGFNKDF